ncbi:MAG: GntR family transcriptional regulator [Chloroflexi bacterium]|nr:GntR family transcriptional regulator [Chloroflexota bacterium]
MENLVLAQIRPTNLREQVVQQIRTAIIEGRIKPNDHLTEVTLTEQLGVSRTPIREALILLEREGLVIAAPNRGCFVRAFSEQDVDEIFSMRVALENLAGKLIIDQLDASDYHYLYTAIANQRSAIERSDFKQVRAIDMAFHEYLVAKSKHRLLIGNWMEIVAQIAAVLYLRAEAIPNYDEYQSIQDHTGIVEAYKAHDLARLMALNEQINLRVSGECKRGVMKR